MLKPILKVSSNYIHISDKILQVTRRIFYSHKSVMRIIIINVATTLNCHSPQTWQQAIIAATNKCYTTQDQPVQQINHQTDLFPLHNPNITGVGRNRTFMCSTFTYFLYLKIDYNLFIPSPNITSLLAFSSLNITTLEPTEYKSQTVI